MVAMAWATVPAIFAAGSSILCMAEPTVCTALAAACHDFSVFSPSLAMLPVLKSIFIGSMPSSFSFSLISSCNACHVSSGMFMPSRIFSWSAEKFGSSPSMPFCMAVFISVCKVVVSTCMFSSAISIFRLSFSFSNGVRLSTTSSTSTFLPFRRSISSCTSLMA